MHCIGFRIINEKCKFLFENWMFCSVYYLRLFSNFSNTDMEHRIRWSISTFPTRPLNMERMLFKNDNKYISNVKFKKKSMKLIIWWSNIFSITNILISLNFFKLLFVGHISWRVLHKPVNHKMEENKRGDK